jgi:hypothetical protein
MGLPYVPERDKDFRDWAAVFMAALTGKVPDWNIPAADFAALGALYSVWDTAWQAHLAQKRDSTCTQNKNDARKALEKAIRSFVKSWLINNPRLTNGDKVNLGLPVYDGVRTKSEPPTTRPEATFTYDIRQITVKYKDAGAKKRGKPTGYHGVDILWSVLDHPPADIQELVCASSCTKSPAIFDFQEHDRKKSFYCCLRWENSANGKGPWSGIYEANIP